MPAAIARDSVARGDLDFLYFLTARQVLRSENEGAGLSDGFLGAPSENSFRARTPVGDAIVQPDHEHRVLGSAFDEQPKPLLSNEQRFLPFFLRRNIPSHPSHPGECALFVIDGKAGVPNPAHLAVVRTDNPIFDRHPPSV